MMKIRMYSVEPFALTMFGEQIRPVVETLRAILETTYAANRNREIFQQN